MAGRPETTAEKAQRVAGEAAGTASQKAGEYGSAAASHASDIAQDAQDAYNRQHGDSAYQKVRLAPLEIAVLSRIIQTHAVHACRVATSRQTHVLVPSVCGWYVVRALPSGRMSSVMCFQGEAQCTLVPKV